MRDSYNRFWIGVLEDDRGKSFVVYDREYHRNGGSSAFIYDDRKGAIVEISKKQLRSCVRTAGRGDWFNRQSLEWRYQQTLAEIGKEKWPHEARFARTFEETAEDVSISCTPPDEEPLGDWGEILDGQDSGYWEQELGGPDDSYLEEKEDSYVPDTDEIDAADMPDGLEDEEAAMTSSTDDSGQDDRRVTVIGWLSTSPLARSFKSDRDGFFIPRGSNIRLTDGSVHDAIDWLAEEGISDGLLIAGYSIAKSSPDSKFGERLSFFKRVVDAPFAPAAKRQANTSSGDEDIPF